MINQILIIIKMKKRKEIIIIIIQIKDQIKRMMIINIIKKGIKNKDIEDNNKL